LPNNTTVYTFAWIRFRRAGQQGPIRTLTAALKRSIKNSFTHGCEINHANAVVRAKITICVLIMYNNLQNKHSIFYCQTDNNLNKHTPLSLFVAVYL